jgi:hypothetical protein
MTEEEERAGGGGGGKQDCKGGGDTVYARMMDKDNSAGGQGRKGMAIFSQELF